ncbi:hypothetical protein CDAR_177651 [Caerostris darwini]|uniref:Uncharacterized protein n=1 Tax=Caerostris darwini TaxID=1538125 RepID=A0AAV4P1A4_9ARAC|nr:hypothetical protein CDAR_177651 [Caerostris darwini]
MICGVRGKYQIVLSPSCRTFRWRNRPFGSAGLSLPKSWEQAFRQLLSLLATTFAISEMSCAAFGQEAQQYLGNEWHRERAAVRNVVNKQGLMLMGVRCNKFAVECSWWVRTGRGVDYKVVVEVVL